MSDTAPAEPTSKRWTDRLGVRWRSTAAPVIVVGIALLLSGLPLVLVLRHSLVSNVDAAVVQCSQDIAAQIGSNDISAGLPTINPSARDGTQVRRA